MKSFMLYVKCILVILVLIIAGGAVYTTQETEQALVMQWGKVIGSPVKDAGLHFKLPIIQSVVYLPKNILEWDGPAAQYPTADRRYLVIDTFGRWNIVDPVAFLTSVGNLDSAMRRIDDIMTAATKNIVANENFIEVVRDTDRPMDTFISEGEDSVPKEIKKGRSVLMEQVRKHANASVAKYGIELTDIKAKRVKYVDSLLPNVYSKMSKERESVAAEQLSIGQGESARIKGQIGRELNEIKSAADMEAQKIIGKAKAQETAILAKLDSGADFYKFREMLSLYREGIGKGDNLILSTESPLLKLMTDGAK